MPQRSDAQDGRPRRGEFYAWRYMYTTFIKRYTCRPCVIMIMRDHAVDADESHEGAGGPRDGNAVRVLRSTREFQPTRLQLPCMSGRSLVADTLAEKSPAACGHRDSEYAVRRAGCFLR